MSRRFWLLMAPLAALWGASYLFIKVGLDDDLDPLLVVLWRLVLGAAVLVPLAVRAGAFARLRGRWWAVVVMAVVQVVVPFMLITYGEQRIPSSLAGILVASSPIFTALLVFVVAKDDILRGWGAVGIVLGMVGVGALFGVDLGDDSSALVGGLMVLVASLGYAVGALWLRRELADLPSLGVAAGTMVVAGLVLAPTLPFSVPDHAPSLKAVAALVTLGAGGTGIAFWIFYTLIAESGASRASLVAYIAPGFAVLYGVTLLDEPLTAGVVVGLALILLGSWLAAEGRLPGRRPAAGAVSRSAPSRSSVPAPERGR